MATEIECDVCINGGEGDAVENAKFGTVVSSGKVLCDECEEPIPDGKSFLRITGKCDGDKVRFDICELCQQIGKVFGCGDIPAMGTLWYEMEESAFPRLKTSSPCFRALTPAAKQFVLDRWKKWKFRGVAASPEAKHGE